jgi:hypothetical protein
MAPESWYRKVEDQWKKPPLGYFLLVVGFGFVLWWMLHKPPPNYSLIAMAVVAGLMALRPEMSGKERSIWAVLLIMFALIEINAIRKDKAEYTEKDNQARLEHQKEFQRIMDSFMNTNKAIADENSNILTLASLRSKVSVTTIPGLGNIQERALSLSQDILKFVVQRDSIERNITDNTKDNADYQAQYVKWQTENAEAFVTLYLPRIVSLAREAKHMHVSDDVLDKWLELIQKNSLKNEPVGHFWVTVDTPIGSTYIYREIAERLSAMAAGSPQIASAAKGKALDLAAEITGWLQRRQRILEFERMTSPSTASAMSKNTPKLFLATFGARLEESIMELRVRGAALSDTEEWDCLKPVNSYSAEACVESVKKRANELPN